MVLVLFYVNTAMVNHSDDNNRRSHHNFFFNAEVLNFELNLYSGSMLHRPFLCVTAITS